MFLWLAGNTLGALPLALVALGLRRCLPRPRLENGLWTLVLLRLVLPPIDLLYASAEPPPAASPVFGSDTSSLGQRFVRWMSESLGRDWSNEVPAVLTVLLSLGMVSVLLRELGLVRRIDRRVLAGEPPLASTLEHVRATARQLGARMPGVRLLPETRSPFLWALRRPVLVLPAGGDPPSRAVLAHEFAHLARRDHWRAWLELIALALHYWNPLYWLARRHARRTGEMACDALALERFPEERLGYARQLVESCEGRPLRSALHVLGAGRRDFEERLRHVLRSAGEHPPRGHRWAWILAGLISLPGLGAPTLADLGAALPELPTGVRPGTWQALDEASSAELALDPNNGAAWGRRGSSRLGLGRLEEAIEAFREQAALGHRPPQALYNRACAETRLGRHGPALESLAQAAALGLAVEQYAPDDPDLVPLRDDPRARAFFFAPAEGGDERPEVGRPGRVSMGT